MLTLAIKQASDFEVCPSGVYVFNMSNEGRGTRARHCNTDEWYAWDGILRTFVECASPPVGRAI